VFYSLAMKQFIDNEHTPDYFVQDEKYYIKHTIQEEYMEHEFKIYYKNNGRYFVGIGASQFVRKITPQDFKRVQELKVQAEKRADLYLKSVLF